MANLISAYEITKTYGAKTLFDRITFAIEEGEKIGLIGPNGAGKSTLLQILAKQQTPDRGKVSYANSLQIGYLKQSPLFPENETVIECLMNSTNDPYDPQNIALCYEMISKLDLENSAAGSDKLVNELSGGWKKRVALARELVKKPNLLLLDEPTNHLDIESIEWLEEFVSAQHEIAILCVTHDRLFLQNTCDVIFDLDPRNPDGIIKYTGSYAEFLDHKEATLQAQRTLEDAKRNILRRETAWLRRGAKARQTKQKARIERAHDLKDDVQALHQKNLQKNISIQFADDIRNPQKIIEVKDVSHTTDLGKTLFKDFSFILRPQSRIGLMGKNGCGKTTLIKNMLGMLAPQSGSVWISEKVNFCYFEQLRETLDPQKSLLQNICPDGDYVIVQGKPVYARSYLSRFHYRPEQMDMPVEKLSGGEQSRLRLAQILMQEASVLILDEPTNDLDIETLEILQEALSSYQGAVILVTHDRYFMDQVVNQILYFDETHHKIMTFSDYFQWQQWKEMQIKEEKETKAAEKQASSSGKTKLTYKEQRELDMMESRIQEEELKLEEIKKNLELPENASQFEKLQTLSDNYNMQKSLIDQLYKRWEELTAKSPVSK